MIAIVAEHGYERREKPFRLSSGYETHDYIDGKQAVAETGRLLTLGKAFLELAAESGVEFDAVGGLTMGADPMSLSIAVAASDRNESKRWFSVRKDPKVHGKQKRVEGSALSTGDRVLLVDDVVTTGKSILQALDAIEEAGAHVVLATALVDRGDATAKVLADRGIAYEPLLTYRDLGIDPVPDDAITY